MIVREYFTCLSRRPRTARAASRAASLVREGLGAGSSGVGVVMLTYYYRETYGGDTYHGNAN